MECVNCGKSGHSFRDCKSPTASFGVIAIRFTPDDEMMPNYLLIRRRDSLGYVDFLRGKYSLQNTTYITILLNQMTIDERKRLLEAPFDTLWVNLWNSQNTRQYRTEHDVAKRTFEQIRDSGDTNGKRLETYIQECTTAWNEPEWGYPKGRRSPHESEVECAGREFCEETGLRPKDFKIRTREAPEYEKYTGTNGIEYKHTYYIADCNTDVEVNTSNRVQTREVGGIGWFSFEDAYLKIRSTNPEKRAVLARVHARILGL
jgi:8-oxo-dGTP pyrophosphatase MutT (NUDIX family)